MGASSCTAIAAQTMHAAITTAHALWIALRHHFALYLAGSLSSSDLVKRIQENQVRTTNSNAAPPKWAQLIHTWYQTGMRCCAGALVGKVATTRAANAAVQANLSSVFRYLLLKPR